MWVRVTHVLVAVSNRKGALTLLLVLLMNEPESDAVHAYVGFVYCC